MKQRVHKGRLQNQLAWTIRLSPKEISTGIVDDAHWHVRNVPIGASSITPFMPFQIVRRREDGTFEALPGPSRRELRFKTEQAAQKRIPRAA